jgi:hypothetical protein
MLASESERAGDHQQTEAVLVQGESDQRVAEGAGDERDQKHPPAAEAVRECPHDRRAEELGERVEGEEDAEYQRPLRGRGARGE